VVLHANLFTGGISPPSFGERVFFRVNIYVVIYYSFLLSNTVRELCTQLLIKIFFMERVKLLPSSQEGWGTIFLSSV